MSAKSHRATAKGTTTVTVDHDSPAPGKKARVKHGSAVPEPKLDQEAKVRKPHRFKAGTRALMDIKHQQKSTKHSFARDPYGRLIRRIARYVSSSDNVRITIGALETLQQIGENHTTTNMAWANMIAVSNSRKTVMPKDLVLVFKMQPNGKSPSMYTNAEMEEFDGTL